MDRRVQGFDPAVYDFGKTGMVGDLGHRDAGVAQGLRRASGRQDLDGALVKEAAQLDEAGLVGDRNQGATDLEGHGRLT